MSSLAAPHLKQTPTPGPETIIVDRLTNQECFERPAAPDRVGLVGGPELISRLISQAQRHLTRYSRRDIAGTVWAMRHPGWCPRENLLAREQTFYGSSFVRPVFGRAGIDLASGVAKKTRTRAPGAHQPAGCAGS